MLNKSDIAQIRTVVKEEVSTQLKPVNLSLNNLETGVDNIKKEVGNLKTDMKFVKKGLKKVEKLSKDTLDFLDRQNIDIEKRTKRIEDHLDLNPIQ